MEIVSKSTSDILKLFVSERTRFKIDGQQWVNLDTLSKYIKDEYMFKFECFIEGEECKIETDSSKVMFKILKLADTNWNDITN